ncbi:MAG: TetR/AcrR family transcriptional regulator [Oscillospiraceae bacterium]|nr:TetR/AcrR family transcriptional regulator [Oscillospiraceae bacterium]
MAKQKGKFPTKEKIMRVAAKMFSERGYDKVTTREIAKVVGINSASIYYYFPSKEDILKSLYRFYNEELRKVCPDLNELLRLAETDLPYEVLMKSEFHYNDKDMREMLDQILVTAALRFCGDPESERFLRENIFDNIANILRPLLLRLIELKKIKSFDVDSFIKVMSYYCYSAAALNNSDFKQDIPEYQAGMALLFSIITPTDN